MDYSHYWTRKSPSIEGFQNSSDTPQQHRQGETGKHCLFFLTLNSQHLLIFPSGPQEALIFTDRVKEQLEHASKQFRVLHQLP